MAGLKLCFTSVKITKYINWFQHNFNQLTQKVPKNSLSLKMLREKKNIWIIEI